MDADHALGVCLPVFSPEFSEPVEDRDPFAILVEDYLDYRHSGTLDFAEIEVGIEYNNIDIILPAHLCLLSKRY